MKRVIAHKMTMVVFVAAMAMGASVGAQEPPPNPPVVAPPPVSTPAPTPPGAESPAAKPQTTAPLVVPVRLTEAELRSRRDAMFMMEAALARAVESAALSTQREIESLDPRIRATLFSQVRPSASGTYLEDYGVFFQVQIPSYVPSIVSIVRDLAETRPGMDRAMPTAMTAPRPGNAPFDPDALYVDAVRRYLIDAMLKTGRSLDLRPDEWLTVSARGEEGGIGGPSVMILRVKSSDLNDFLAGRLSSDSVMKKVQVSSFSSRR